MTKIIAAGILFVAITAFAEDGNMALGPAAVKTAAPAANPNLKEVIIVFKQHYDVGFWGVIEGKPGFTRPVTAKKMTETFKGYHLDQALEVFAKTAGQPEGQRYTWAVPGWVMAQMLDQADPQRRARVAELIKTRRLDLLANPFTPETESFDVEDFVRSLGSSSRIARELGMPLPTAMNITDVPAHSWCLATIAKHAGINLIRIGCNPCSTWPDLPRLFQWEGPDGSRVLTMYNPVNYGSDLQPPKNWPYKTWLWMNMKGDNLGSHNTATVQHALARAARELPGVRVRIGTLEDFAAAIIAENPDLPVIRQDTADTWIHGIMAMPAETKLARNLRPKIMALESLDTLLGLWTGRPPDATPTVAAAYAKSIIFGEHTWGSWLGDTTSGGCNLADGRSGWRYGADFANAWKAGLYQELEDTYIEHGEYIRDAAKLAEPALADRLARLAAAVNLPGRRVVVFNPLPWERDGWVELPVAAGLPAGTLALRDPASGQTTPAVADGQRLRFQAGKLPPLGYKTFDIEPAAPPADSGLAINPAANTLENRFIRVTLDPRRGVISSIFDKQSQREWVDAAAKYGFGQYLYERFTAEDCQAYRKSYGTRNSAALCKQQVPPAAQQPRIAASPETFALTTAADPLAVSATLTAKPSAQIPHETSLKIILRRDSAALELEWTIRGKTPDLTPEGGWLCLPVKVANPQFRLSRMGGVVDPAKDIRRRSNLDIFCLDGGMTVTGDNQDGIGLCSPDAPLVSLGYPGLLRFAKEWVPRDPVVFINLFNNVWGCNFRQWVDGSWSTRVRLWPAAGGNLEATLMTPSREFRTPLLAAASDAPAGNLPASQAGIGLSRKGVLVTAFGANPDGSGTLLRVWEQAGQAGDLAVTLPADFATATPVNLRGEKTGAPVAIIGGKLTFPLSANAPASFILNATKPNYPRSPTPAFGGAVVRRFSEWRVCVFPP
jgi:hypothetical protein